MARVTHGVSSRRRHKRTLKQAESFWGRRRHAYKLAKMAVMKSMKHAFAGRKQRKRDMRGLWVTRLGAAARMHDMNYSRLIAGLKKAGVEINRKMLSELAVSDPEAFGKLAELAKEQAAAGA